MSVAARTGTVVLDTNVVSELMRAPPDRQVEDWASAVPPDDVYTTSITVAEVRYGIARLPIGRRRANLSVAADEVFEVFADRVLPFDVAAAVHYADIVAGRERIGSPIAGFDAQIAAICRSRGAALATRNTDDFDRLGLFLVNPWLDPPAVPLV